MDYINQNAISYCICTLKYTIIFYTGGSWQQRRKKNQRVEIIDWSLFAQHVWWNHEFAIEMQIVWKYENFINICVGLSCRFDTRKYTILNTNQLINEWHRQITKWSAIYFHILLLPFLSNFYWSLMIYVYSSIIIGMQNVNCTCTMYIVVSSSSHISNLLRKIKYTWPSNVLFECYFRFDFCDCCCCVFFLFFAIFLAFISTMMWRSKVN